MPLLMGMTGCTKRWQFLAFRCGVLDPFKTTGNEKEPVSAMKLNKDGLNGAETDLATH